MKIVFVSSFQYPSDGATTNRHLSYARGLVELGHSVYFLLLLPQNRKFFNQKKIEYNGIHLECFSLRNKKTPLFRIKRLFFIRKWIKEAKARIKIMKQEGNVDALVLVDIAAFTLSPFVHFGKKLGIKVFHERTEYPHIGLDFPVWGKLNLYKYLFFTIHQFDGIYVISKALANYFIKKTKGKVKVEVIHMTVEPDRFENIKTLNQYTFAYIAYCGIMYGDKDGVLILIESFKTVSEKWPNLKLLLIGDTSDVKKFKPIRDLVVKNKLEDKIIFTGRVSRDQMPVLLNNAEVLVLARPNNKQAEGGFPTKLGEYLATGKPVVVTSVGEIPLFLKDGVNAFIAKPGDADSFANKLDQALSDKRVALQIGANGKKLVYDVFNFKVQANKLAQFLKETITNESNGKY